VNTELEFNTWGTGADHALDWSQRVGQTCDKCGGAKVLRAGVLPVTCPKCEGRGVLIQVKA
jgi:DnaJ-class molecular chaperone